MPINADEQIISHPDYFVRINSWILLTNSRSGQHSLYLYSDGILRFQIIPLGKDRVTMVENIPNLQLQLITVNSHFFNIMNFFFPALSACDVIEITIADLRKFRNGKNLFDIDWRFIKTA